LRDFPERGESHEYANRALNSALKEKGKMLYS
jgi:hypothetical protein